MTEQPQLPDETCPTKFGRKYRMTMIGVCVVLAIGVFSAAMKKFAGLDVGELAKWAMAAVAGTIGLGAGAIAYEDGART